MSISYPLLLFSWVFLLPVIVRSFRKGERPIVLLLVFGLNLLFTIYEGYMTFIWSKTVVAPIRVDIFGVVCVLVMVNTLAGLSIILTKPKAAGVDQSRTIERLMGVLMIGIALNSVVGLLLILRQGHKASQTLSNQQKQDFAMMFQDTHTVEHYFGDISPNKSGWAGHYTADPTAHGWLTRLMINTEGKAWLFFKCEANAECVYVRGEDGSLMTNNSQTALIKDLKPDVGIWTASIELKKESDSRLRVSLLMNDQSSPNAKAWEPTTKNLLFTRTTPPTFPKPSHAQDTVTYLGVFSNGYLERGVLFVVQIWLWQQDNHLFGRYMRRGWQLGTKADFISAQAVTGTYDKGAGHIAFAVSRQESFDGHIIDDKIIDGKVLWFGRPLESIALKKKELIPGFPFEFAPLASEKTTKDWLETTSFGKMVSWQVPASFDPSAW